MTDGVYRNSIDTVVIGGGQAGLATSYHLKTARIDHVVLDENEEVGASWRNRWDSLRLFTPAKYSSLPGLDNPAPAHARLGKDDIADYLQDYARRFDLPVTNGVKVNRLDFEGDRYFVYTSDGPVTANNVVVATGGFGKPRIPAFADKLDEGILQMHSSEYQRPSQLQDGPVLVVGAGQSGAEIALELVEDRAVWISGHDNGEEPIRPGSKADRFVTPIMVFMVTKVINVANPIGRKVRDHFLRPPRGIPRAGGTRKRINESEIDWVGRTTGVDKGRPQLDDGRVLDVANVVWCTGFTPGYDWIDLPIFDEYGYPDHNKGVVEAQPGLYFIGLLFQRSLSSALIVGVGRDARYLVDHIAAHRSTTPREHIPEGSP